MNVLPIPGDLSFDEAAAVPLVFLTAWHMLFTRARIEARRRGAGDWRGVRSGQRGDSSGEARERAGHRHGGRGLEAGKSARFGRG